MEYKNNLDKQYCELLKYIKENGYSSDDRTGTGTIKSFGYIIKHNMDEGFPILTTKKVFTKGVLHEVLWFLSGNTNIKYLVDNGVNIWVGDCYKRYKQYAESLEEPDYSVHTDDPIQNCTRILTEKEFIDMIKTNQEFADKWGELNKVYGSEWRDWYDIDQVQELIDTLKTNPDSRRMIVTAWNPVNVKNAVLPPCHNFWQVVTRSLSHQERHEYHRKLIRFPLAYKVTGSGFDIEDMEARLDQLNVPKHAISLQFNMRSVDVPLGLPFNITSYAFILEMLAKTVNMVPDQLSCTLGDIHIYKNQLEGVEEQLKRSSHHLPQLNINTNTIDIDQFKFEDFEIVNYISEDKIFFPLSN